MKFKEYLKDQVEQPKLLSGGRCICMDCGYEIDKPEGKSCSTVPCPTCKKKMKPGSAEDVGMRNSRMTEVPDEQSPNNPVV